MADDACARHGCDDLGGWEDGKCGGSAEARRYGEFPASHLGVSSFCISSVNPTWPNLIVC